MKRTNTSWNLVLDSLQLGGEIVFCVIIGAAIGWYLDGWLGTFPYLSIIWFILGVAASGRALWREVRKQQRTYEDRKPK